MKQKNKDINNKLNEPQLQYGSVTVDNSIHFFNSTGEQEEDNYIYLAGLSPAQHIYNATELIKRIFAEDLKKNNTIGNRIYFK